MNESEPIGSRIVRARAAQGMSQAELATQLGVAATQVARWEKGKATPRPETLHKMAAALDVSPLWLERAEGPINGHDPNDPAKRHELVADLTDEELRILRRRAAASGRTLTEEMSAVVGSFLEQWQNVFVPPGWLKLQIPDDLEGRLKAAAEKNGRSLSDEIIERVRLSLDADDIASEPDLPERTLPPGAKIDHGVQVWAERLLKPGNRRELETLLATIRAMLAHSGMP
ncbi:MULTISPECIES: helix-turn-helix domain-containing protein [unclassified Cupriavidus]|uniref:helix-turn-helix domain-containing protein n=1 Tax=unclassified Cupriavidus TaxID=2640874 RepID=UPI00313EE02A